MDDTMTFECYRVMVPEDTRLAGYTVAGRPSEAVDDGCATVPCRDCAEPALASSPPMP